MMIELKGWSWESGGEQATLRNPPPSLGCSAGCLGSSDSMAACRLLVVSLTVVPGLAEGAPESRRYVMFPRLSFLTVLRFLSIPTRAECSQFIVYGGFLHTHPCFPLRSVLFPRPTQIPEHGWLACQV